VEVAVIPVLLGGGIPLLPSHSQRVQLKLVESKASANGTVSLNYLVQPRTNEARRRGSGEPVKAETHQNGKR